MKLNFGSKIKYCPLCGSKRTIAFEFKGIGLQHRFKCGTIVLIDQEEQLTMPMQHITGCKP